MRSKFGPLLIAAAAVAGCSYHPDVNTAARGVEPVNVPVVSHTEYAFDVAAPGGSLASNEKARLDAWFRGLGLGYGDSIYVDSGSAEARHDVAQVAGNYGMLIESGVPATAGAVPPGMVRVVVSRARAEVPGCPNWRDPSEPNYNNRSMSNFGCGVNSNLAMQVANPEDLLHGREGASAIDSETATKAIVMYRNWPLTALQEGQLKRPFKQVDDSTGSQKK